ncbi:hypothetical protein JTM72_32885, partial [Pseudomonas aeruginosa]|nr:hypothetical protein [Pseudomonas aeruginosa]
ACSHLTGTLTGRLPLRRFFQQNRPVSAGRDRACAGQVECKGFVSWNAIDWSVVVQIVGKITETSQMKLQRGLRIMIQTHWLLDFGLHSQQL